MTPAPLWPDESQTLLLRAALGEGEAALEAFRRWRAVVDFAGPVDGGTFRLLPLLHGNLTRLGYKDSFMPRLRGVYRREWCASQRQMQRAADVIGLLSAAGLRSMVVKGLPLAIEYYESPGYRPMSEIDVVVPVDQARRAVQVLQKAGWRPEAFDQWSRESEYVILCGHAISLKRDLGDELDLHWRPCRELGSVAATETFWQEAVGLNVAGADTLRPSGTHILLHVVVHGMSGNDLPTFGWIADVAMILKREGPTIAWDNMVGMAKTCHVGRRLGLGLSYLRHQLGFDIPEAVLNQLCPVRPTRLEQIERRAAFYELSGVPPSPRLALLMRLTASGRHGDVLRLARLWVRRRLPRAGAAARHDSRVG